MADGLEHHIYGLDELIGKLQSVKDDVRKRGGRSALRKAARIISDRAALLAAMLDDKETGRQIAANIAERWDGKLNRRSMGDDLGFRIGVLHGAVFRVKGNPDAGVNGPTPHWRLLELGTEKNPASPFMLPAMMASQDAVITTFVSEYGKSLDRALLRAQKKSGRS